MSSLFFSITAIAYSLCALLYWLHLTRGNERAHKASTIVLAIGLLTHISLTIDQALGQEIAFWSIDHILSLLSLGSILAFTIVSLKKRLEVLGAFIVPIALMLFLTSSLGH